MKNKNSKPDVNQQPDWANESDDMPPSKTIFYTIIRATKQYKKFAQYQFDKKFGDITVDQAMVLSFIEQHPELSQSQIAELVFIDNASISRIIDLIKKNGYITREINQLDRRKFSLKLTSKAKQILYELRKIRDLNRVAALDGIDANQLSQLKNTLEKLINNCEIKD